MSDTPASDLTTTELDAARKAWAENFNRRYGPFAGIRACPQPIQWQLEALACFLAEKPMRIPAGRRAGHTVFFSVLEEVAKGCHDAKFWCRENPDNPEVDLE